LCQDYLKSHNLKLILTLNIVLLFFIVVIEPRNKGINVMRKKSLLASQLHKREQGIKEK